MFCGASNDARGSYYAAAWEMGQVLAGRHIEVVYGGGSVGMMGAVADAALEARGKVTGVIPMKLMDLELGHKGVTDMFVVDSMHARKSMMMHLADAFIALPGGYGTLEELFEVVTWAQLNYHRKPVGLLNVEGYFDHLQRFLHHAADEGFIRPQLRDLLVVHTSAGRLIEDMEKAQIPEMGKWLKTPKG
ncbi:MAG: TIGR00730 family Rossman fold protein [Alphaproteobacteria bacterium]|nr:TIGR00730 family Rossman fold protein [Alphaproteobacteria bacterium]MCB9690446.1 TIGR00730 family Rossman fold protein [Alphaproteobacteria bacterium]